MTSFLQKGGITLSAIVGLLLFLGGYVLWIPASILFGSAIIAAQLAKLAEREQK